MTKSNPPRPASPTTAPADNKHAQAQGVGRETVESIAFAFVLALLFRSFVAEAFVIPTGSMAPTLYGRNKDVVCPACGHDYAIGASDEVDDRTGRLMLSHRIQQSQCPNCRHQHDVKPLNVFKGDRILVNKSAYQFGAPDRWDVIVFRYPEETEKNYIKRLVGLPGETIRIARGDVYARPHGAGEFQILRKQDPNKQKLLQQVVYDDRHPPRELIKSGWPEAWQPEGTGGWTHDPAARRFDLAAGDAEQSVRFHHRIPSAADWAAAEEGKPGNPRHELVSDFCGYNAYIGGRSAGLDDDRFWVGDLTLSCRVALSTIQTGGTFTLELNEGVRQYRCQIDVFSGMATLSHNDDLAAGPGSPAIELAKVQTPIRGPGTYTLRFANVDDRLCLWVNEGFFTHGLVGAANYEAPANRRPQARDLTPVAFAAHHVAASVSDLVIERDIYYRAERITNDAFHPLMDHEVDENIPLRAALSDPEEWGQLYERHARQAEFNELGPDEFFVMGDNSPRSQDSRLWPNHVRRAENRHAVERQALIGKAFFIYWPHGIPFLNGGKGFNVLGHRPVPDELNRADEARAYAEYSLPFYPQWWRWKRIR